MDPRTRWLIDWAAELNRRNYVARVRAQNTAAWAYVLSREAKVVASRAQGIRRRARVKEPA